MTVHHQRLHVPPGACWFDGHGNRRPSAAQISIAIPRRSPPRIQCGHEHRLVCGQHRLGCLWRGFRGILRLAFRADCGSASTLGKADGSCTVSGAGILSTQRRTSGFDQFQAERTGMAVDWNSNRVPASHSGRDQRPRMVLPVDACVPHMVGESRQANAVTMAQLTVWTVGAAYAALAIFLATRVVNRRYSTIKAIAVFTVAVSTGLSSVPLLLYFCR